MEKNQTLLSANIAVWGVILVLALVNLTGCSTPYGADVGFYIHPVNYVDDHKGLSKVQSNGGAIIPADDKRRY